MRETTVAKLKQLSLQTNCAGYKYSQANFSWRAFYIYIFFMYYGAFIVQHPLSFMRLAQSLESEPCQSQRYQIKHRITAIVNKP